MDQVLSGELSENLGKACRSLASVAGNALRIDPYSEHEWQQFCMWLNYVDKGLQVAYDMSQSADATDNAPPTQVSTRVTAVRWYATDLALLMALIYKAAGLLAADQICRDADLANLHDEMEKMHPQLRDLRNALFAHPPFVDRVLGSNEVLFFTSDAIVVAPASGGAADLIIDPVLSHPSVLRWIEVARAIFMKRQTTAHR